MNTEQLPGKLRPMKLTELDKMLDLMEVAFADDAAREGRSLRADMAGIQRLLPVLRVLMKIKPSFADKFYTLAWEVDSRFVAGITLSQQGSDKQRWYIFNVATHPDFRGRGLARKLVTAALDHVRARGGKRVLLDVRADNVAAYNLYASVGFLHLETSTTLKGTLSHLPDCVWPSDYTVRQLRDGEWQPAFDLAQRVASEATRTVCPITPDQFRDGPVARLMQRVMTRAQKRHAERWLVERAGQPIGLAASYAQLTGRNPHHIKVSLDPAAGDIAPALLAQTINRVVNGTAHACLIDVPGDSSAINFLKSIGCEAIETTHQLGLAL
ncbi:MAG: GNAT family N-acetyltransferase [Thermoflexales bacterium]|nr:GNAT family N-acetyltransferase [Thermoflexales bacterium]